MKAALNTRGEPSDIPPRVPPEWLVFFTTFPLSIQKASLLSSPMEFATLKPSPISKPFTAPIDMIAFPRFASNLSNTGSPSPAGRPVITHSHIPPAEFLFLMH